MYALMKLKVNKEKEEEQGLVLIWGGWGKTEISFTLLNCQHSRKSLEVC